VLNYQTNLNEKQKGAKISFKVPAKFRGLPAAFGGQVVEGTISKVNKKSYEVKFEKDGAYICCLVNKKTGKATF